MSKEQLVQRLLCSVARVDSHKLRTGYLSDADWPRLTTGAGILSESPIYVDDTPGISLLEMRAKARRLKAEQSLGLVIIDYLQLISGRGRIESRQQEISEISRSLKAMAKELNVPVVALSQLSRAVESRQPPRPQLSDLRESGAIEQDADVVTFLYRPSFYRMKKEDDLDEPEDNSTEVIIGKQRNGPTGTVYLAFLREFTRFEDQEREREFPA
jgi:replicative DNA helicase